MERVYFFVVDSPERTEEGTGNARHRAIRLDLKNIEGVGCSAIYYAGKPYEIIFASGEDELSALEKLNVIIQANGLHLIPFPTDWRALHNLVHTVRSSAHTLHYIVACSGDWENVDMKRTKRFVKEKIDGNLKWNRKLQVLLDEIEEYEEKPSKESLLSILKKCDSLGIPPILKD